MAFKHVSGPALMSYWPKTASTALTINTLVTPSSGALVTAVTATTNILGVLQRTVASSDSDYASTTKVPVLVPTPDTEFEVDLTGTTTFAATFVGTQVDIDGTGAYVDATATSHKQCTIIRQGSSTSKAIVKINGAFLFKNAA